MLSRLFIKNVALIDSIEIDFSGELNILTGETGAGKSIIIDSIGMVLGNRISKDIIRTGKTSALVEAFFDIDNKHLERYLLDNQLYDEDNSGLILSREMNINGKNICRINGRAVPVSMLKEIGRFLIDIHGQNDNQSLLDIHTHIKLLDSFGREELFELKSEYKKLFNSYKDLQAKIDNIGGNQNERERRLDLLKYQFQEINSAKLIIDEDKELESQKLIMDNSSKMISSIEETYDILSSGGNKQSILDGLSIILKNLSGIEQFDSKINEFIKKIEEVYYVAEDLSFEIRKYSENLEFDPKILEEVEERIDLILRLKRKYGLTIQEILEYKKALEDEIHQLETSEETLAKYAKELEKIKKELNQKAYELSNKRKIIAKNLEKKIIKELEELQMKNTQFVVEFSKDELKYSDEGIDKIEFLISPNLGENLKPLSKIASGGEMSRIMLAIKTILADVDDIPILIFDEIDNGISGIVAQMVGQKLAYISKNHQVLCITHLPQIASMSDSHYYIEKVVEDNNTKTKVKKLSSEEKKNEIARIIGGIKVTETTLKSAEEMIKFSKQKANV